jgi:hypothetical protein
MLMQKLQRQMVRPPVLVRRPAASGVIDGALWFVRFAHVALLHNNGVKVFAPELWRKSFLWEPYNQTLSSVS